MAGAAVARAPQLSGELRESAKVMVDGHQIAKGTAGGQLVRESSAPAPASGRSTAVEIVFTADHAAVQHERTDLAHPHGGQAKFLESSVKSGAGALPRKVGEAMQKALRK